MRIFLVFAAGILVGTAIQTTVAQTPRPNLRLNHVGISVKDLPEALKFYQEKLGFNEVVRNPNGMSAYIQVSRDTFLELQQAAPDRPPGFIHIGLEVGNLATALPQFRRGGLDVGNPSESERTKALISQATGPNGLSFELLEFGPESLQRKVINAWK